MWRYYGLRAHFNFANDSPYRYTRLGDALGNLCTVESESKPWEQKRSAKLAAMDFYGVQRIIRANMLYLLAEGFSARARNQLLRLAAFRNPDFYKSQAMRLPIYDKPRIICAAEEQDGYLVLPRCCEDALTQLLDQAGAAYVLEDKTCVGNPIRVSFKGALRDEQVPAAEALLAQNNGVLSATTAFTPLRLMACGACSREEPQPKFSPPRMMAAPAC